MLQPLREFLCDGCRQPIVDIDDGWVEWLGDYDKESSRLLTWGHRICHNAGACMAYGNNHKAMHSHLKEFTGDMAMLRITKMLDVGPYHARKYEGPEPKDLRAFTDFIRRLTLPYYDEARVFWEQAIDDGYFIDDSDISIYMPETLKALIAHYSEEL